MVFVTGGTGFLGAHLLYQLLKKGENVTALRRPESKNDLLERVFGFYTGNIQGLIDKIDWIEGDLLDIYSFEKVLNDVSAIYHSAAIVSFQPGDKNQMMHANIQGAANLVNIAIEKKIKKFCHVSSIAAIGRADNTKTIDEQTRWRASKRNSSYAISKYGAEREVWRGIEEGLNAVIINPSIILGPGEINSGSGKLIATILKGLKFYTSGINGYVDVRDVARAMIKLVDSDISGERFVVSAENLLYKDLFEMISKRLGKSPPTYKASWWMGEIAWRFEHIKGKLTGSKPLITRETANTAANIYVYSNKKIINQLNFQFTPIQQTVNEACDYYLKKLLKD